MITIMWNYLDCVVFYVCGPFWGMGISGVAKFDFITCNIVNNFNGYLY